MRKHISSGLRRGGALFRTVAGLTVLALVISGCNEPINTYQVAEAYMDPGEKVLVLPFMDTRTFIDGKDPHKEDLGEHARDIFVSAMRDSAFGKDAAIITPDIPGQSLSLTNAQVAEYGRRYGADIVVAGQMFSYTGTRAASIPPRAGMFVRVVSAKDGTLLFVGDHYQAAAIPGASGGRELQARNVSNKLIEGMALTRELAMRGAGKRVASTTALASLAPDRKVRTGNNAATLGMGSDIEPLPLPPPPVDLPDLSMINADDWDRRPASDLPPLPNLDVDVMSEPVLAAGRPAVEEAAAPEPEPPVAAAETTENNETDSLAIAEPGPGIVPMAPPVLDEAEDLAATTEPATNESIETVLADGPEEMDEPENYAEAEVERYDWVRDASDAARMTGDELAADLFESESPLLAESISSPAKFNPGQKAETVLAEAPAIAEPAEAVSEALAAVTDEAEIQTPSVELAATPPAEPTASEWRAWESAQGVAGLVEAGEIEVTRVDEPAEPVAEIALAASDPIDLAAALDEDNGPVVSVPLAVEQPRPFRSVDLAQAPETDAAIVSFTSESAYGQYTTKPGAIRVLVLPYHERTNTNNLIDNTGGGEVVTTLYGSQLALDPEIQVLWDASGQTSHDRLIDREEALQLGRMVDADYVVRGQVVEFRRAQSVPSLYSAVISTAVLAAQIFFAEMSGVDVATEVYRVSDGMCVMSRRDRAQQKYVVQAEKTVRRMAEGMVDGVTRSIKNATPEAMDPLIDGIEPVTVLSNPW